MLSPPCGSISPEHCAGITPVWKSRMLKVLPLLLSYDVFLSGIDPRFLLYLGRFESFTHPKFQN